MENPSLMQKPPPGPNSHWFLTLVLVGIAVMAMTALSLERLARL